MSRRVDLTASHMILIIPALNAPVAQLDRVPGYEPGGREFESLRARQNPQLIQALTTVAGAAFCFNNTSAGLLRDCTAHTLFVASIRFSNSAAE